MNPAISLYRIGELRAEARIAMAGTKNAEAIALRRQAVTIEDTLAYDEPQDEFFPTRHLLGAVLLATGDKAGAEAVYARDLALNPANGWALYGLAAARGTDAGNNAAFTEAWAKADTKLVASAF
jgi:tetratricopeptide (TPR) repeat protein